MITPTKPKTIAVMREKKIFSFINRIARRVANIGDEFPIAETSAKDDKVREVNQKYNANALTIDLIKWICILFVISILGLSFIKKGNTSINPKKPL